MKRRKEKGIKYKRKEKGENKSKIKFTRLKLNAQWAKSKAKRRYQKKILAPRRRSTYKSFRGGGGVWF
jgi:hypothetical protein